MGHPLYQPCKYQKKKRGNKKENRKLNNWQGQLREVKKTKLAGPLKKEDKFSMMARYGPLMARAISSRYI
jgi:hypothetical protein